MKPRFLFLMFIACLGLCAPRSAQAQTGIQRQAPPTQLVQSIPAETDLADPSLPFAKDVWVNLIQSAKTSVDAAEFYVTNRMGSALEPVLAELEKAGTRGVKVRSCSPRRCWIRIPLPWRGSDAFPGRRCRASI